jgi:hypothetical protein
MRPLVFSFPATAAADRLAAVPTGSPELPRPADLSFDYCGICTIINLAGAIVPPATPAARRLLLRRDIS